MYWKNLKISIILIFQRILLYKYSWQHVLWPWRMDGSRAFAAFCRKRKKLDLLLLCYTCCTPFKIPKCFHPHPNLGGSASHALHAACSSVAFPLASPHEHPQVYVVTFIFIQVSTQPLLDAARPFCGGWTPLSLSAVRSDVRRDSFYSLIIS